MLTCLLLLFYVILHKCQQLSRYVSGQLTLTGDENETVSVLQGYLSIRTHLNSRPINTVTEILTDPPAHNEKASTASRLIKTPNNRSAKIDAEGSWILKTAAVGIIKMAVHDFSPIPPVQNIFFLNNKCAA